MSKPKFPIKVKQGHTIVKIYYTPSRGCDSYTVVHYIGNKRHRTTFSDLGEAKTEAATLASTLSRGQLDVLTLTNQDRLTYVRAQHFVQKTGLPIDVVAMRYAELDKILDGRDPVEAARFFAKLNPIDRLQVTVSRVRDELLKAKQTDGLSDVYIKDLRLRIKRFAEAYGTHPVTHIQESDIDTFLRDLKDKSGAPLSGKSRNNYRRAIGTLLGFAEVKGYVTRGVLDLERVSMAKEDSGDIAIFTPAEMQRILHTAQESTPELVPFLAIGAFAGLRHAEVARLDWREVRTEDGFIEVKASKAKTASRRLVPITENLKAWLKDHQEDEGDVTPYHSMSKQILWLAESVDAAWKKEDPTGAFSWKRNALRHSYISYRLADVQNVAQVSLEAGNSPRMVFAHYRELVRPAEAQQWFGIMPKSNASN